MSPIWEALTLFLHPLSFSFGALRTTLPLVLALCVPPHSDMEILPNEVIRLLAPGGILSIIPVFTFVCTRNRGFPSRNRPLSWDAFSPDEAGPFRLRSESKIIDTRHIKN